MPNLTLINSVPSNHGSGLMVDTYRDESGNEYTSVGRSTPVLTVEAAQLDRRDRRAALAAKAGIAARAGDWGKADALMAEARAI